MNKHYILNLNPEARADWERCILRNPITGERPDLTAEIAKALGNQAGSYLIKVNLQVEILEQNENCLNQEQRTYNSTQLARKLKQERVVGLQYCSVKN